MGAVVWKGLWARKRRFTGAVIAIVLGVAFLAGSLALGDTLSSNFDSIFTNANAGTDAVVRSATSVGSGIRAQRPTLPAGLVDTIRALPGVADAQPQITGFGQLIGKNGKAVGGQGPPRIASNWIADPALNPYHLVEGRAPRADNEVVINRGAANDGHLHVGDVTTVDTPAPVQVRIVGIAKFGNENGIGPATYTAFSVAGAERYLAGPTGGIQAIVVHAQSGVSQEQLVARIRPRLPSGTEVLTGAEATQQNIQNLSAAFLNALRTVLVVFAAIALLVAMFSIANTFSIVTAQRTREEALLRLVGATRRQILSSILVETLVLGAFASVVGLLGGVGFAALLKALFSAVGFSLPAGGLVITATTVVVSLLVGIVVTVAAALIPAARASRVAPIEALRGTAAEPSSLSRGRAFTGGLLLAIGVLVVVRAATAAGGQGLGRVGLGALLTTTGVIVLGPVVARAVTGALAIPFIRRGRVTGELARDNVTRNPRRSAAAASALLIGVAIVTLFTVFAASLKTAETNDVDRSFVGDIAVSAAGFRSGLAPALTSAIQRSPGVADAAGLATGQARVAGSSTDITAVDPGRIDAVLDLHPTAGSPASLSATQLAVSQHQADAKHWHLGSPVDVMLPDGADRTLTVGAIYSARSLVGDYVLPISLWSAHAQQVLDSTIFVKVAPGADAHAVQTRVTALAAPYGTPKVEDHDAFVRSAGSMIEVVLGIVYVLLALAVVIALFGIANTLSLSIYERTREIGLLRAIGQSRRQLRRTVRLESLIVSLFGTIGGIALGTFLGWGLAEAAHRAQGIATFTIPVARLVIVVLVGAGAGLLAGSRPAARASRLDVLTAIGQA